MSRARTLGVLAAVVAMGGLVYVIQGGGTDPAPVATLVGSAAPPTTAPATTTALPVPTATPEVAQPRATYQNAPGRDKDAEPAASAAPVADEGNTRELPPNHEQLTCKELEAAGFPGPFPVGHPLYHPDRDNPTDGTACE
jgi:hypothetical protein